MAADCPVEVASAVATVAGRVGERKGKSASAAGTERREDRKRVSGCQHL